jgi:hypothetical protein
MAMLTTMIRKVKAGSLLPEVVSLIGIIVYGSYHEVKSYFQKKAPISPKR